MDRKIILFELNEVPFKVIDNYCAAHPQSFLAKNLPRCQQYETYSDDKKLSPWTTWPTLHRGVLDEKHTIHHFGQELDNINEEFPSIWEILRAHEVTTGVCGSLHSYPVPKDMENYSFYIPDVFAAGSECFPKDLSAFQEFSLKMARDSARNVGRRIHWDVAVKFLATLPQLGFKLQTVTDVAGQLLSERLQRWKHVRRRTYQAVLAFDVFMKQLENTKPSFVTFFTNHVASSMHRYWAAAFPGDYDEFGMDDDWVTTYRHEIEFTMSRFDRFFERLVKFVTANPKYQLWIATSMGQAATIASALETELLLDDVSRFMESLGVGPTDWERLPAMVPQVNARIGSAHVSTFRNALRDLIIDGDPVSFDERDGGFFSLTFGQQNLHDGRNYAVFRGEEIHFEALGLKTERIDDRCGATAYHIPTGSLLIYDPVSSAIGSSKGLTPELQAPRPQISTLTVAPQLLRNFSVPVPDYMIGKTAATLV